MAMTDDARARRIRTLILLGVLAAAAVVVAIALGGGGGKREQAAKRVGLLDGIPDSGLTLGDPGAPAEVEEFLDLQCPFCAQFSREAFPTVVRDYVRTGKLKITLRPLAFLGQDSVTGARALLAAADQDKAFGFVSAFYTSQGAENSGYVTQDFLNRVGGSVKGLDTAKVIERAKIDASFTRALKGVTARARKLGVNGSPTFVLTRRGQPPVTLEVDAGDYKGSVTKALGAALGQ